MSASGIADRFWDYRLTARHWINLSNGDPINLEMWNDLSDEGVADFDARSREFAAAADSTEAVSAVDQTLRRMVESLAAGKG